MGDEDSNGADHLPPRQRCRRFADGRFLASTVDEDFYRFVQPVGGRSLTPRSYPDWRPLYCSNDYPDEFSSPSEGDDSEDEDAHRRQS